MFTMNDKDIEFISDKLNVDKKVTHSLHDKLQIANYKIGELIFNTNPISKNLLLLLEGKIRLRGVCVCV